MTFEQPDYCLAVKENKICSVILTYMPAGNPNWKKGVSGNPGGRPKKWNIQDYINDEDVVSLVKLAKQYAIEGKPEMLKWLLDQIFGKAKESMDMNLFNPKPIIDVLQNNSHQEDNGSDQEDTSSSGRDISQQDD